MRTTSTALSAFCLLFFISAKVAQLQIGASQATAPSNAAEIVRPAGEPVELCLAPASVQIAVGKSEEAVHAVRDVFVSFLSGPMLTVTPLTSRLAFQAKEEAKQGHCRYVLFVTLTHKKKTGGSGLCTRAAGEAAGTAVWQSVSVGSMTLPECDPIPTCR